MAIEKLTTLALSMFSNKGAYAIFCGAGISRSAGIITGWEIENDLIRRIAATKGIEESEDWHEWYKKTFGRSAEYSTLLDEVAKTPTERVQLMRAYFEPTEDERDNEMKLPTKAHRAIAQLAKGGYIKIIITTNFDRLFETAFNDEGLAFQTIYHVDDLAKITPLVHSGITLIKLNGDYLDCRFRNTTEELDSYQPELEEFMTGIFQDFGLVTCGWSAKWDKGLIDIINKARLARYGSYFAFVGSPGEGLKRLAVNRNADLVNISDADKMFSDVYEQVTALEKLGMPETINADVFVARVKKYISNPEKQIELVDLIEMESKNAQELILKYASYNFTITSDTFRYYFDLHRDAVGKLIPAAIAIIRWGNESQIRLFEETLVRLCIRPFVNNSGWIDGTQYLHQFASCLLFNVIGVASLKYQKFSHLKRLFELKVPSGNMISFNEPVNLAYIALTDKWEDSKVNVYRGTRFYYPFSQMIMKELWVYFKLYFILEPDYEQVFCAWSYLWSLMYQYYNCDPFVNSVGAHFPMGIFNRYAYGYRVSKTGFYYNFLSEVDVLKDKWEPLTQGLFDGNYDEFVKIKNLADGYYRQYNNGGI